jgi:DNA-directed RNA polymerase specialized sigma24 family protein
MSKAEIARTEGVAVNAVKDAISRGLKNIEKFLRRTM